MAEQNPYQALLPSMNPDPNSQLVEVGRSARGNPVLVQAGDLNTLKAQTAGLGSETPLLTVVADGSGTDTPRGVLRKETSDFKGVMNNVGNVLDWGGASPALHPQYDNKIIISRSEKGGTKFTDKGALECASIGTGNRKEPHKYICRPPDLGS